MPTKKAKSQPAKPLNPAPDEADQALQAVSALTAGDADQTTADANIAILRNSGKPVFTETDLGRVQALPDLAEAPQVSEAVIPEFAPGAIQFFKANDGATCRVVAVEGQFYTMEHER